MNRFQILTLVSCLSMAFLVLLLPSCGKTADAETPQVEVRRDTPVVKALEAGVSESIADEGIDYFVLKGCNRCHKTKGKIKTIGPILAGIKDRMDIPNLETWIRYPRQMKPGTLMPRWDGDDQELIALIAYLRTL